MLHPLRWIRRLVSLALLGMAVYYGVSAVQVATASRAPGAVGAAPREPFAVVVSAGAAPAGGGVGPELRRRLHHAARLRAAGRTAAIVVVAESRSEADGEVSYLRRDGVPAAAVSSVVASDLAAQLRRLVKVMPAPHRALVVADSWQTLWVTHVAGAAGLEVVASPVTPVHDGVLQEVSAVALQGAAVAWGRVAGFGSTGFIAG